MGKTIDIGGRIHNPEVGNVVTGANEILDDTKNKKQDVINSEVDAALEALDANKQDNLTFDQTPTESSTNPVTSGGVYAADALLQQAIEAILVLIPSAATALNQLADKAFVNSTVATNTATFRGTYNVVTDLGLAYNASHQDIATALLSHISTADNNDYAFVQIPVSGTSEDIRVTERYKFNGTVWGYEYDLNNSGFTALQWAAINSGITALLVTKLGELPTAAELATSLAGKQNVLTFDNVPVSGSNNPVKSGGLYQLFTAIDAKFPSDASANNKLVAENRLAAYVTAIIEALDASFNLTSADGHVTFRMTQTNGVIASVQILTSDIASASALTTLGGRVSTNETDIANLQAAYAGLTQSDIIVGTLPSSGQQQNIIYRQPDPDHTPPQFYSDYMWNGTTWVLMAQYNNAIDEEPTKDSHNLVESGGVEKITNQLSEEIHQINGEPIEINLSDYEVHEGGFDGNNWWIHPYYQHVVIPVVAGQQYTIVSNANEGFVAFQLEQYDPVDGQSATILANNYDDAGDSEQFSIVPNAHFLLVFVKFYNRDVTPDSVSQTFYGGLLDILNDNINQELGVIRIELEKGVLNSNGTVYGDEDEKHSDLISVKEGEYFYCKSTVGSNSWNSISYYDSNKTYIQSLSINKSVDGVFIVPSGVSYMRISGFAAYPIKCTVYRYVKNDRLVYSIPPLIKYPNLLTERGCLSFQMDVNHTDNPLSKPTYKNMLSVLKRYGIMTMDFALMPFQVDHSVYNIGAETNLDLEWFRKAQSEGCEIIFHTDSIVGNNTDISNSSTLTIEEAKAGLNDDLDIVQSGGFVSYGIVAQNGEIKSDFIPFINKQFLWTTFGNARIQDYYNWQTYKSSFLNIDSPEYHRVCRTSFEMSLQSASESDITTMIQRGKLFIDIICSQKCMGTIYCHSYNNQDAAYSMPQDVLLELCAYIKEKIADGLLVVGSTTECLNYLCSK